MATISNTNDSTLIAGTAEADSISTGGGYYVTIKANKGDDTISASDGLGSLIYAEEGDDYISGGNYFSKFNNKRRHRRRLYQFEE